MLQAHDQLSSTHYLRSCCQLDKVQCLTQVFPCSVLQLHRSEYSSSDGLHNCYMFMQGELLLCVAADAGKMDEVDRLLSQGVDVNAYGPMHGTSIEVDASMPCRQQSAPCTCVVSCGMH